MHRQSAAGANVEKTTRAEIRHRRRSARSRLGLGAVIAIAIFGAALVSHAQDDAEIRSVTLMDGTVVEFAAGSVVVDESTQEVRGSINTQPQVYEFGEVTPRSLWAIRRQAAGDDFVLHFAIGEYCVEHELWDKAEIQFREARRLSRRFGSRVRSKLGTVRTLVAKRRFESANAIEGRGELQAALTLFEELYRRYSDTQPGQDAGPRIATLQQTLGLPKHLPEPIDPTDDGNSQDVDQGAPAPAPPPAGTLDRREISARENIQRRLAATQRSVEEAKSLMEEALAPLPQLAINTAKAVRESLLRARKHLADARPHLDADHNADLRYQADGLHDAIATATIQLGLHFAHYYVQIAAGDVATLKEATLWVNSVFAFDPRNDEAKALRMKITDEILRSQRNE